MRVRPGSLVFKHLALERWTAARELHTRALRNRSQVGFHTLRIGIKRFRYIVENFLPEQHQGVERRPEAHARSSWRGARSGRVVGDGAVVSRVP